MSVKRYINEFLREEEVCEKEYLTDEETSQLEERIKGLIRHQQVELMAEEGIEQDSSGYYKITNTLTEKELDLLIKIRTYHRLGNIKTLLSVIIAILVLPIIFVFLSL